MSREIPLADEPLEEVTDLFVPPGGRDAPAVLGRETVDAMLCLARNGCRWRSLPERCGSWTAVWARCRRWRANGVWAAAMALLGAIVRNLDEREPAPSIVVDCQADRGACHGPNFHDTSGPGCRSTGAKRSVLV